MEYVTLKDQTRSHTPRNHRSNTATYREYWAQWFLHKRKVPGYVSPACTCGARNQTSKHILLFCPEHVEGRQDMLHRAGTSDFHTLLSTRRGLKAATAWFLNRGILEQFSLAREMAAEASSNKDESSKVVNERQ